MTYADNIRALVRGRITKHDTFKIGSDTQLKRQNEVEHMLNKMSVQQIYDTFPEHTYDFKKF